MTVLIDARLPLFALETLSLLVIREHENGTRAQKIKFLLDGILKQSIQFKITVLSVVQEPRCLVWAVLTNTVTKSLLLIVGFSEGFELYYGENGELRAYNVKMLVMTFRSACVKSRWPR